MGQLQQELQLVQDPRGAAGWAGWLVLLYNFPLLGWLEDGRQAGWLLWVQWLAEGPVADCGLADWEDLVQALMAGDRRLAQGASFSMLSINGGCYFLCSRG